MKRLLLIAGAVALVVGVTSLLDTPAPEAADHGDPPAISANQKADINDVYAWMDGADHLALSLTVERAAASGAAFSQAVQYAFHVGRGGDDTEVICQFDANDNSAIRCWIGDAANNIFIQGDPTGAGLTDQGVQIFAGLRNDPFFFNLTGFLKVRDFVEVNGGSLTVVDGCPDLSGAGNVGATLAADIVDCLTTQCDQGVGVAGNAVAVDDFGGENVLALVLRVPITAINGSGDSYAVYASTHSLP